MVAFIIGTVLIWGSDETLHDYKIAKLRGMVEGYTTAYTASVEETDSTPTITASGEEVREGIVACPRDIPFKTKVFIDGKILTCADRMNERYEGQGYFDIFMHDYNEAVAYGKKKSTIYVVEDIQ